MSEEVFQRTVTKCKNFENEDQGFMTVRPVLGPMVRDFIFHRATSANSWALEVLKQMAKMETPKGLVLRFMNANCSVVTWVKKAITRPIGSPAGEPQQLTSWGQAEKKSNSPGRIKLDYLLVPMMTMCDHYVLKAGE